MTKTTSGADSDTQVATQASSVFGRLEHDILTGHLKPGIKLRLNTLIDTYDTGNSPLREALNRLTANGMVIREENRGFRVAPASIDELMELTKIRCWLEEIGIRESIANGDTAWEERIVLAFHRLTRAARRNEEAEYQGRHELEEHRNLQEAVLQRNADLAVKLLHSHYEMTSDILVSSGNVK